METIEGLAGIDVNWNYTTKKRIKYISKDNGLLVECST